MVCSRRGSSPALVRSARRIAGGAAVGPHPLATWIRTRQRSRAGRWNVVSGARAVGRGRPARAAVGASTRQRASAASLPVDRSGSGPRRRPGGRRSLEGTAEADRETDTASLRFGAARGTPSSEVTTVRRMTTSSQSPHPVSFGVDYPERDLNRLTTGFRIFTVVPIAIVLGTIGGYSARWGTSTAGTTEVALGGTGLLFIPTALMIIFRQRYPRWW